MPDVCQAPNSSSIDDQSTCNPQGYTYEERQEALRLSNEAAARSDLPIQSDPYGNALAAGVVTAPFSAMTGGAAAVTGMLAKKLATAAATDTMTDALNVPSNQERAEAAEAAERQRRLDEGATPDNPDNACSEGAQEVEECGNYYDPDQNQSRIDDEAEQ